MTKAQWAIAAMATMISFCGSYFLFDAIDVPRLATVPTTAPPAISEPIAKPVPSPAPTPKVAPAPTTTVPKTTAPATKPADKKADCGDGVCVSPENPDRCPTDCPVR